MWECLLAVYALSSWNKVMLPWVPGHFGTWGDKDVDALARDQTVYSLVPNQQFQSHQVLLAKGYRVAEGKSFQTLRCHTRHEAAEALYWKPF